MTLRPAPCLVVVALLGLCGCPKSDSDSKATDTSKPMAGGAPTNTTQLVGAWAATTDGDFKGIEFTKDGKALLNVDQTGSGFTVDYSLQDGGKLRVIQPGAANVTQVFDAKIDGDVLELKTESNMLVGTPVQRFRRLKSGQTLAAALKEVKDARVKTNLERADAVQEFLKKPGLVLVVTEPGPGAPPAIAVKPEDTSQVHFKGKAWHDDKPPHVDEISGKLTPSGPGGAAQLGVVFGPRIQPPAQQQQGGGQITLNVTGEAREPKFLGKITYGGRNYDIVLKSDPAAHDAIVKRFDGEVARAEAMKEPVAKLLKDYAVLRGTSASAYPNQPKGNSDQFTLIGEGKTRNVWRVEGSSVNNQTGASEAFASAAAEVAVVNDQPMLRIVAPPNREYLLKRDAGGKFSGFWHAPYDQNGRTAQLEIVESMTAQERDQKFAEQRKALTGFPAGTTFFGAVFTNDPTVGVNMAIPVSLELTAKPDGGVTGTGRYPSAVCTLTLAGQVQDTPTGPRMQLKYTGEGQVGGQARTQAFAKRLATGIWVLGADSGGGANRLVGTWQLPGVAAPVTLEQVGDERRAQLRSKLAEAMAAGQFTPVQPPPAQGREPTVLELNLDPDSKKVTGQPLCGGQSLGAKAGSTTFEGDVKDQDGWVTLAVSQTTATNPRTTLLRSFKLIAVEDGGVLHLNGNQFDLGRPDAPQRGEPAFVDLVPVSSTDAETQKLLAKAVADVAQHQAAAKKAADDAAKAKADADAARAKLASDRAKAAADAKAARDAKMKKK